NKENETSAKVKIIETKKVKKKQERDEAIYEVKDEVLANYEEDEEAYNQVAQILETIVKEEVRRLITQEKIRPDGRSPEEIRPLSSRVHILPRTHGSGLFTRGQTQVLSVCTLGALG